MEVEMVEEGRPCRKRKESGDGGGDRDAHADGGGFPTKLPSLYDDDEELVVDESMLEEVMRSLEEEINYDPSPAAHYQQIEGMEVPIPFPSPSSVLAPSFVTINGNEESCGPSVSDSASTVMASIDTRGVFGMSYFAVPEKDPVVLEAEAAVGGEIGAEVEEGEKRDEEWLTRVLGGCGSWSEMEGCNGGGGGDEVA